MSQAARLTTDHFRKGEEPQAWAARKQKALTDIKYQHLGGKITGEAVTEDSAFVVLEARVAAVGGVSLQKEPYTLKRIDGQWLIDEVEGYDEVVPEGKLPDAL